MDFREGFLGEEGFTYLMVRSKDTDIESNVIFMWFVF